MNINLQKYSSRAYPTPGQHQGCDTYQFFGVSVSSQLPLPELFDCRGFEPVVTIWQVPAGQVDPDGFETRFEWLDEHGHLICSCGRRDDEYLLYLPEQASFYIGATGVINCVAAPGVGQGLLRQLLLSQVLPRYLAHTGELLLHASAVTLPNGSTVAFLGDSGFGKSTLASYCQLQGAHIIDDDCVLLRSDDRGVRITGGVPTLRLYPDSLRALGHDPAAFAPYANASGKQQMRLAERAIPAAAERPLDALFLLSAPSREKSRCAVRVEHAAGQTAMMSLLRSAFNLDPSDPDTLSGSFRRVARVLGGGLPVYELHYPREHTVLPQVLQVLQGYSQH